MKPALATKIRTARLAAGLTQAQLAEAVGTSQGRIGDYENGRHEPRVATLEKLAAVLKTTFTIGGE